MRAFIEVSHIKAALLCTADDVTRPYLRGVALDVRKDNTARLVATNGHKMIVCRISSPVQIETNGRDKPDTYILPPEILRDALKIKTKLDTMQIDFDAREMDCSVTIVDRVFSGKLIDAVFPNYVRAIPRKYAGNIAQFNAQYLADFQKAAEYYLSNKKDAAFLTITHAGDYAALIRFSSTQDAFGILMPMRDSGPHELPEWFTE